MPMRPSHAALAAAVLQLACAPAAQRAYIAPTNETVFSQTDERQSDPPVHTITVVNASSVPVIVWSIALNQCENIKLQCGPRPVNFRVPPGGRTIVLRVEPGVQTRGFSYSFSYSWRADSSASSAAVAALASAGDPRAQETLDARRRADSIARVEPHRELTRDDFRALAGRALVLRAIPDTLVIAPGRTARPEDVRIVVADSTGQVLGRTSWVRWTAPGGGPAVYSPADQKLHARHPGQSVVRYRIADEAETMIGREVPVLEMPVVVRHTRHPNPPVFLGRALDSATRKPLACARVALEDSARNVIARDRTTSGGDFMLSPAIPGTYRVRIEAHGWAPVHGPVTLANPGEEKQNEYLVQFTEQMLMSQNPYDPAASEPPRPVAVRVDPVGSRGATTALVQNVTLGGSASMPILGIATTRVPVGTLWMQVTVDSTGAIDPASLTLPAGAPGRAAEAVGAALGRMRFAPAKDRGAAVCELMRMQVNFSPR